MNQQRRDIVSKWGQNPQTIDELFNCMVMLVSEAALKQTKGQLTHFSWLMTKTIVSNANVCPVGGITNWIGTDRLVTGYPGWSGRINLSLSVKLTIPVDLLFQNTLSHPGLGHGGTLSSVPLEVGKNLVKAGVYPYDHFYRLFDDDWPDVNSYDIFGMIKHGSPISGHVHEKHWVNPEWLEN